MRVGFIGAGKLGLPVALAIEAAGHEVAVHDVSHDVKKILGSRRLPYVEQDAQDLLEQHDLKWTTPVEIAEWADLVFVAVQTPHRPEFEGITRLPNERADFDYGWLKQAVRSVSEANRVVVISTVLPGTVEREIYPIVGPDRLLYNPFFIAMGTTIPDFRDPEFVLVGTDGCHPGPLRDLYASIHSKPVFVTTVKTAELTKVAYNTFIGLKIAFANTMMELCEKTGADVDDLTDALSLANKRLVSSAYLRGGMGDGGGCHPRDNIALSWLAREVNLSYDLFEALMVAREKQTEWLALMLRDEQNMTSEYRPIEILGKAYKPETALTVGSPSILLSHMLTVMGVQHDHSDPYVEVEQ